MSKNLTRKGLAFGAGIALVASGLAGAPAQADTTGPITLVPNVGTGFNSILQSGITLKSEIDPSTGVEEAGSLAFLIENPAAAVIGAVFDTAGSLAFMLAKEIDVAPTTTAFTGYDDTARLLGSGANRVASTLSSTNKFVYITGSAAGADEGGLFANAIGDGVGLYNFGTTSEPNTLALTTDETDKDVTLYVTAWLDKNGDGLIDTFEKSSDRETVVLYAPGSVTATTAITYLNTEAPSFASTVVYGNGVNPHAVAAKTGVKLFKNGTLVNVSDDAFDSTDLDTTEVSVGGISTSTVAATGVNEEHTFTGVDVNVASTYTLTLQNGDVIEFLSDASADAAKLNTAFKLAANGYDVNYVNVSFFGTTLTVEYQTVGNIDDTGTTLNNSGGANGSLAVTAQGSQTIGITKNVITAGVTNGGIAKSFNFVGTTTGNDNFGVGNYTAQAVYQTGSGTFAAANIVTVGSTSVVSDLTAGSSADMVYVTPTHTTTEDTKYVNTDNTELLVRSGTKTVTFGAQIEDSSRDALDDSNVEVKAVVSESALGATSTVTITGSTGSLKANGSAITAYARTDSDGKVSFTLTSTTGTKADAVDVAIYAKNSAGVWVLQSSDTDDTTNGVTGGLDIVWQNAVFTDLKVTPAAYVSGANPTVSFKVVDQFGGAIGEIDDLALSIYAVASFGGVADPATFSARASITDGTASFTFANFAKEGSIAQLSATLYKGAAAAVSGGAVNVNVYNTAATAEVTIADSFITNVTYKDYVTGDASTTAVAAAITARGIATTRDITGAVLTASGVGQPGLPVVISAPGVLFNSGDTWAEDTITAFTNEFGSFTVGIATHVVNTTGATMTIAAGGVSTSTKLISYLPEDLDSNNLVFGWDLPSVLVKNTTYVLTGSLTDKWGNPVQTSGSTGSVIFQGTGSVEVNGITNTVAKDFDKNGKSIVFIRSVKDIAGPGSVTATLQAISAGYSINPAVTPSGGTKGKDVLASVGNVLTDVVSTIWDETVYERVLTEVVDILDVAPAAAKKVNAGSFKGYVALYALGYEGQRMSAKVGNDWVIVPAIPKATNDLFRAVEFVGAGVDISVRIYIDRVLLATIPLLTK
jgi:hypothetical protein